MSEIDEEALAEAYNRGLDLEKAGDLDGAAEAYRLVLEIDPDDRGGASVRLAAMGRGQSPDKAPDAYVSALFDQHAEVFESILVDQLGYHVPMMVGAAVERLGLGPFSRLLDLGCGTGLSGDVLFDHAEELVAVDLSEAMVEAAYEKDVYDRLYVAEAVHFLEATDEPAFDMIVATDVLPYMGRLEAFFSGLAAKTAQGGIVAFSTETLPDEAFQGRTFMVGPKQRFAHRQAYIRALLDAHGFTLVELAPIVVRHDEGEPVPGHLVIARKG